MTAPLGREQAAAAAAAAVAERDTIQANLLELDNSFGKRLLAGATLTGETKKRWDVVAADLTTLWQTFDAYSAVVDKAAELMGRLRRSAERELAEISSLLNGASVQLSRPSPALARGDLTGTGNTQVTLAAAVTDMRRAFAAATPASTRDLSATRRCSYPGCRACPGLPSGCSPVHAAPPYRTVPTPRRPPGTARRAGPDGLTEPIYA